MTIVPGVMRRPLLAVGLIVASLLALDPVSARSLPKPAGRVILTISGAIEHSNSPEGARFDLEMLTDLGLVERQIDTEWTDEDTVFEGVPTRTLLEFVGAHGEWVKAVAANDYTTDIPLSDLTDHDTLLALFENGKRMTLRDKGPAWIVYDNHDHPRASRSELNRRMVWQLTSLTIR